MPFVVTCPKCNARYSAPDNLRGQGVQCPSCQASFVAGTNVAAPAAVAATSTPAATASTARPATAVASAPRTFATSCTHCRKRFSAPENLRGQLARCPGCGQSFTALPIGKTEAKPVAASAPAAGGQDWKWFEENYEPYKPPAIVKEERHRPQISLPKVLLENDQKPIRLATRSSRLLAVMVDSLLGFGIPAFLFFVSVASTFSRARAGAELTEQEQADMQVGLIICIGAFAVLGIINLILLGARGQTIGKAALGIKIVGSDGYPCFGRIFFIRMLGMNFLTSIPIIGPVLAIADVLMIFRESRQCLHDQLADTVVIRAR